MSAPDPDQPTVPARSERFAREFAAAGPALLAWARLRVKPELRAMLEPEDLVQEIGCRAFANFDAYDGARGTFRQWLFGFGNRVLLEALRRAGRDRPAASAFAAPEGADTDIAATVTTITQRVAREEVVRLFLARIDELDEPDRTLLLHRGLEGMSHADLARLLGVDDDVLRKRWSRLCERMRSDPVFASLAAV